MTGNFRTLNASQTLLFTTHSLSYRIKAPTQVRPYQ